MAKAFLNQPLNIDQRKLKTEAKLYQALLELHQTGIAFNKISIQQLCERAQVSRATFYRHHDTIADVIMVASLTFINQYQQQVDAQSDINFDSGSQLLVALLYTQFDLFQLIAWSQLQTRIAAVFAGAVQQTLRLRDNSSPEQRFISQFLGTAILNFNLQVATSPEPITQTTALKLFRGLFTHHINRD